MATDEGFVAYVLEQIAGCGEVSHRKMFGEYMVYCGGKPALLVCGNTVFVKCLPEVADLFARHNIEPETGCPYAGAKPHYVLDIDNGGLARDMAMLLAKILPAPKPKKSNPARKSVSRSGRPRMARRSNS
jgi:hypothetical protein